MSDVQFLILIAVIIGCTVHLSYVIARATKASLEHVSRFANVINETLKTLDGKPTSKFK
jgi:hypothetical protein